MAIAPITPGRLPSDLPHSIAPSQAVQRLLLENLSWSDYEALLVMLRYLTIRITYDRSNIELVLLSDAHKMYARLLDRLIRTLAESHKVPIVSGEPVTFKRRRTDRGLQPDKYYYFREVPPGRGVREILPDYDPVPDLVVEIDLEGSLVDRMGAYAALGFPEVWRYDGAKVRAHVLQDDGRYASDDSSPRFLFPHLTEAVQLLRESENLDETSLIRSLPGWISEEITRQLRERPDASKLLGQSDQTESGSPFE